jgi:hypothetical protein
VSEPSTAVDDDSQQRESDRVDGQRVVQLAEDAIGARRPAPQRGEQGHAKPGDVAIEQRAKQNQLTWRLHAKPLRLGAFPWSFD